VTETEINQIRQVWGELASRPRQDGDRLLGILTSFIRCLGFRIVDSGNSQTAVSTERGDSAETTWAWAEATVPAATGLFPSNRALFFAVNLDDHSDVPDVFFGMSSKVYGRDLADSPATVLEVRGNRLFRDRCNSAPLAYHVLDRGLTTEVLRDPQPVTRYYRQLRQESAPAAGNPFQFVGPVTRPERFVGRRIELRQLVYESTKSFAVIGPRKSGKTSLLYRARDMINAQPSTRPRLIEYIDLNPFTTAADAIKEIAARLVPRAQVRWMKEQFPGLLHRLGRNRDCILILDEMDEAIRNDRVTGEWLMHSLLEAENVRLIIAGHGALARSIHEWTGKLWNGVEQLNVGGLDEGSAQDLIQLPFSKESIDVPSRLDWVNWTAGMPGTAYALAPNWVEYITTQTARRPSLIQLYGWHLHRLAAREGRNVRPSDIKAIEDSVEFREYVLDSFLVETEAMTRILGLILVLSPNQRLSEGQILAAAREHYPKALLSHVQRGLHELEHVGLIALTNGSYQFAYEAFPRLLRQFHNVRLLFQETLHELNQTL